jgi:hypothetical protein
MAIPGWRRRELTVGPELELRSIWTLAVDVQRHRPDTPFEMPVAKIAEFLRCGREKVNRRIASLVDVGALIPVGDEYLVRESVPESMS